MMNGFHNTALGVHLHTIRSDGPVRVFPDAGGVLETSHSIHDSGLALGTGTGTQSSEGRANSRVSKGCRMVEKTTRTGTRFLTWVAERFDLISGRSKEEEDLDRRYQAVREWISHVQSSGNFMEQSHFPERRGK